ncbi:MAG: laccase domain-containing protein, partial [Inhella sp.]|uniref:laccase domain-containing protein n=1 Tax=Inhella sp. TaxID=1921806 RepID=UPI00391F9424
MSTREGGVSAAPWDRLNLGRSVGDDPAAVAENRRRVAALMGAEPVYLHQVHGSRCVLLREPPPEPLQADAAVTVTPGLPLAIQVADCLPVLLTA